ncbi:MAG: cellulase family glycosylhydrolase [Lachnospiraceae bacterium]|nr:cellulase family glycosylhydrolase [Lachnospiraceae bacterium]
MQLKKITLTALSLVLALSTITGCSAKKEVAMPETIDIMAESVLTADDFLKASGRDLKNKSGEGDIVNLRGVNFGGLFIQELWMSPTFTSKNVADQTDILNVLTERFGEEGTKELIDVWQENYITEDDFIYLSNLGVNVVRIPFFYRDLMDTEGNFLGYNEKAGDPYAVAFNRLDKLIAMAGKHGIYVILDCHGAQGSQNGSDHSGVDGKDDKVGASKFFFGDDAPKNQEQYYEMWRVIAARYKGNPIVAGYDLLNEPYCTYRYNSPNGMSDKALHELLWGIYDKAYDVIKAEDPDHVIIMEATWDAVDLPNPKDYDWENVMYEYHNYLYDDYDNVGNGQWKSMRTKLEGVYYANYDVPCFMGEFNYFNSIDAWDSGLDLLTNAGVNWTVWTYKTTSKNGNWGLFHHPKDMDLGVNIEKKEFDEIKDEWAKVNTSFANENERLAEVIGKWCKEEAKPNALGTKK